MVFQLLIACVGLGISFWIYNSGINKNVKDLILAIVVSLYFLVSLNLRNRQLSTDARSEISVIRILQFESRLMESNDPPSTNL